MSDKTQWISVADRLPEVDVPVWVFNTNAPNPCAKIAVWYEDGECGYWSEAYGPIHIYDGTKYDQFAEFDLPDLPDDAYTHWLPLNLPEPPKQ